MFFPAPEAEHEPQFQRRLGYLILIAAASMIVFGVLSLFRS